jgi:hypothetical protein
MRSRHGWLLKEFVTPVCATRSARRPEVLVPPCAPPGAPPPMAPAAPAAVRRAFTPERLRACGAERALSSTVASPGMHLLCLLAAPPPAATTPHVASPPASTLPAGAALAVALFAHGVRGAPLGEPPNPSHVFLLPAQPTAPALSVSDVEPAALIAAALAEMERVRQPSPHQPAALFSLGGVRLDSPRSVGRTARARSGLLLFEGGQWLWPAVSIGQVHTIRLPPPPDGAAISGVPSGPAVRLVVRSLRPRILEVEAFLSEVLLRRGSNLTISAPFRALTFRGPRALSGRPSARTSSICRGGTCTRRASR